METLRILITIKTYPIPSKKYDELVCTAGVTESGDFIRLYPINFRELEYAKQYQKYQWMEVRAEKHQGRDVRKESYRPDTSSIRMVGPVLGTDDGYWTTRARYALANRARSMEDLYDQQARDRTSLGVLQPSKIHDLVISPDQKEWNPTFLAALRQQRLWDDRSTTKEPPRKVPWRFHFEFECDDPRCKRNHKMMIEDWEVGALYWRTIDNGATPEAASRTVKQKFLNEICGPDRDTHFFVGTVLEYGTWVIVGTFWPRRQLQAALFP